MAITLNKISNPFFIGIAGTGMSAIAQYMQGLGKQVSGSDRFFINGKPNEMRNKLENLGIKCFEQNASGITSKTDVVIISTAIEETVPELQKAKQLNIPVLKRAELLSLITLSKKTIAVGGTSGKSTTTAMIYDILCYAKKNPSIISGAGLTPLIKQGKIGNAEVGVGDWLVIEADESDGSIILYEPEIGLLLNIDKDHQEIDELLRLFKTFKNNSKLFISNLSNPIAHQITSNSNFDFSTLQKIKAPFTATHFLQDGFLLSFKINDVPFKINGIGKHTMENALAATAACAAVGIDIETCAEALINFEGIYRRQQVIGKKYGAWFIDDYAHNPVKCAAAILSCQPLAQKVIAWFQPHGYGPTFFLKDDFIQEISTALRPDDEIWMSEIFYAGGTAVKNISSLDLIQGIRANHKQAYFVADRNEWIKMVKPHINNHTVVLLMGARDPSLENFAKHVLQEV